MYWHSIHQNNIKSKFDWKYTANKPLWFEPVHSGPGVTNEDESKTYNTALNCRHTAETERNFKLKL